MTTQGNVSRLPISKARHAQLPVGSIDVLPARAAATWPQRPALRAGQNTVTFAALDEQISRLASGLRDLIGGDGSVVAVSAVLGPDFPVAYYAIARSGNVIAPVNPRLGAEVLASLLVSVGAKAAVLSRAMYDRVRTVLTGLEHVILLDGPPAPGAPTVAELARRGNLLVEPRDRNENELGAIVLGARRSHHRLKIEAEAAGAAHGLSEHAVALNAMTHYRQLHLNAAVLTGTTQVLCASPDLAVQAREASRHNVTHHYTVDRHSWPAVLPQRAIAS